MPGPYEFYAAWSARWPRLMPLLVATFAAGTLSTAVQVLLWVLFTDAWPAILHRDARLAAAIVMGPGVLPPPASFDAAVTLVATVVHFGLSFAYCALVARLVAGRRRSTAVVLGAAFGAALYAINMHGFTWLFPWFAQARDWITVTAHVAFGVFAAMTLHTAGPAPHA